MPPVKPIKILKNGKAAWQVSLPKSISQKRRRFFFASRSDAQMKADEIENDKRNFNGAFHSLNAQDQAAVLRCVSRMDGDVRRLESAVDDWLKRKSATACKRVKAIADELIASRCAANVSRSYLETLSIGMKHLKALFGDKLPDEITAPEIERWLSTQEWSVATRQGYLQNARTLFNFAMKRGYCTGNPALGVQRPIADDKPPGILTVDQVSALLKACLSHDPDLIPLVAVSVFGGLRPTEAKRFLWEHIKGDLIEVQVKKLRSHRRRFVTISPTLQAWLDLGGNLELKNLRRRLSTVRAAAAIPWPADCLRHSFATYHLAHFRNVASTSHEMGHRNATMLFEHYRELVTPECARRFWEIKPTKNPSAPPNSDGEPGLPGRTDGKSF